MSDLQSASRVEDAEPREDMEYTFDVNEDTEGSVNRLIDRITVRASSWDAARRKAGYYVAAKYPNCRVGLLKGEENVR